MKCKVILAAAALVLTVAMLCTGCNSSGITADTAGRYQYNLDEYVVLGEYKGVTVEDYVQTVTDKDVQDQVFLARSNYAVVAKKSDAAVLKDQVNVNFVGYIDGEVFEGGSADNFDITLGSGQLIEGFEEGLVGAKAGDTVTLDLHFPDPYALDASLSGKAVQFVVTINYVNEQVLPEYTDEFVKTKYGYDSIDAFEQALYDSLVEQAELAREYFIMNQVWDKVYENCEILQYPEVECEELYNEFYTYYSGVAQNSQISLNEYAAQLGYSVTGFQDHLKELSRGRVGEEMILYRIAQIENITLSENEYNAGVEQYRKDYGFASAADVEAYFSPEDIYQNLLFDKVLMYLVEQAIVTE